MGVECLKFADSDFFSSFASLSQTLSWNVLVVLDPFGVPGARHTLGLWVGWLVGRWVCWPAGWLVFFLVCRVFDSVIALSLGLLRSRSSSMVEHGPDGSLIEVKVLGWCRFHEAGGELGGQGAAPPHQSKREGVGSQRQVVGLHSMADRTWEGTQFLLQLLRLAPNRWILVGGCSWDAPGRLIPNTRNQSQHKLGNMSMSFYVHIISFPLLLSGIGWRFSAPSRLLFFLPGVIFLRTPTVLDGCRTLGRSWRSSK